MTWFSTDIVCAMLPKPRINRDKIMAITVLDRDVPDNEIVEAFRKKLYDAIESVKWNAKFKVWADLGIQAFKLPNIETQWDGKLSGSTSKLWYVVKSITPKALEKGQKTFTAGLSKLSNALNDLHSHIKLYIDKMLVSMETKQCCCKRQCS